MHKRSNTVMQAIGRNRGVILAWRTVKDFLHDDCPHLAAAIAYYALFSLFPLLLTLIAILGFALGSPTVQSELTALVARYLPASGELLSANLTRVVQAREETGALAVIGLVWSAMAVFGAVRKGLNTAWDLDRSRPLVRQKLLDLAMVVSVGVLFLLSSALTALYRSLSQLQDTFPVLQFVGYGTLLAAVGALLPAAMAFLLFLLVYKTVPFTRVAWSSAALGAGLAAVLFEQAKSLFVWYAQTLGRYELVYGSLGAVIGLLTWVYLVALILLLGAELAAEHGKMAREGSQTLKGK